MLRSIRGLIHGKPGLFRDYSNPGLRLLGVKSPGCACSHTLNTFDPFCLKNKHISQQNLCFLVY